MSKISLTTPPQRCQSPKRCTCRNSFKIHHILRPPTIMSAISTAPAKTTTVALGNKTFTLDREKAELAYAGKRVINGKETMFFNILPLKYQWAYDLYKTMKNNHWEPEDVTMQKDVEHCLLYTSDAADEMD
jgi:hypothetical protein